MNHGTFARYLTVFRTSCDHTSSTNTIISKKLSPVWVDQRDLERQALVEKKDTVDVVVVVAANMLRFITGALIVFALVLWAGEASMMNAYGAVTQTHSQGIFVGNRLDKVDEYLSIPFAQPPTGLLRFAKTKPAKPFLGKAPRNATTPGAICIQPPSTDSLANQTQSEDCLLLNIYKPSTLGAGRNAPVMVWLYGGSWQEGSINQPRINATDFIRRSISLNEPVVWVAANYRVGAFGFLAGQAIVDAQKRGEAVLNAGMWDQREALLWVQANIESFGGDPSRVILFGESAGAINVGNHLLANKGKGSKGLFRGAILESGNAASGGRREPTGTVAESTYSFVLQGAGCAQFNATIDQIHCLQRASTADLTAGNNLAIANSYIAYLPTLDDYFTKQAPSVQWANGHYLKVPFITGDNLDEGTEFPYPLTVADDDAFERAQVFALGDAIKPLFPQILDVWPNEPSLGEPYRPEFFGVSAEDTYYPPNTTNQYKRQASMLQDVFFETGRKMQLRSARKQGVRAWSYRFAQPSPVGVGFDSSDVAKASMGVQHEAEIPFVYGHPPVQGANAAKIPEPLRTFASDENLVQVSNAMSAAWIHFAHQLDPNGFDVPRWDPYASDQDAAENGLELYIQANNFSMVFDEAQAKQIEFVVENRNLFAI